MGLKIEIKLDYSGYDKRPTEVKGFELTFGDYFGPHHTRIKLTFDEALTLMQGLVKGAKEFRDGITKVLDETGALAKADFILETEKNQ